MSAGTPPGIETRRLMAAVETKLFGETADPVTVGRFEVLGRLGEGAMGVVYRARDPGLEREVAVKLIAPRFSDEAGAAARMRREARALARLEHPNVVKVLDVGNHAGQVFVAMEKLDGGTLLDWAGAHPPGTPGRGAKLRALLDEAAAGLAAAHRAGVVHRDIKPHNMLLGSDGRLRLADFGLATVSLADAATDHGFDSTGDMTSTDAAAVVGTPAYMAPEQFDGVADERADQFSLCASFWEAAYGERPFTGATVIELREAIATPPRPPARVRDVPAWVGRVLARGLSENPRDRYRSLEALRAALHPRRRTSSAIAAAVLGVSALLVIGSTDREPDRCASPPTDLERAWDTDTRALVRERFAGQDAAFARVDAGLESYTAQWRTAWKEACAATWHERTQSEADLDVRMGCLARAREAYAAVVDVLVTAELDDVVVTRAATAAENLPVLASCRETAPDDAHPLPDDPHVRAEIERLQGELDALHLFKFAGSVRRDIEKARKVAEAADATGYAPLRAEAWLLVAELLFADDDREAMDVLDRMIAFTTDAGLHAAAVKSAGLQGEAYNRFGRSGGDRFYAQARAWTERIEDDAERERVHMRNVLSDAERFTETGAYQEALGPLDVVAAYLDTQTDTQAAFLRMGVHEIRGKALMQLSRYDEAEQELQRALAQRERLPMANPHHEAKIRSMLAQIALDTGRPEEGTKHFAAMLPLVERSLGKEHPAYAATVGNLAAARLLSGDREGGAAALRESLALFEAINPPGHPNSVLARSNLATALPPGREKMELHRQARDLALEYHGVDSELYAMALSMFAYDTMRAGEHAEAIRMASEALVVFERIGKDRKVADALVTMSRSHTAVGRAAQGRKDAERAVALARAIYGEGAVRTAGPEVALAFALHALHHDADAREALARAELAARDDRLGDHRDDLAALHRELE